MSPLPDSQTSDATAPRSTDAVLAALVQRCAADIRTIVDGVPDDDLAALFRRLDPSQGRDEAIRPRIVTRQRPPDPADLDDLGELEDGPTDPVTGQRPPGSVARTATTSPRSSVEPTEVDQ